MIGNSHMKFCIFETIRMDQTLKGGIDSDLCDDETMRAILPECLSPLPHPVPILASLDPSCEHFHSERFEFICSDCERYLWTFFEFETICMSDTDFCFAYTPTFSVKVRISWNSSPLFSCWLRSCDVCLRLGSRVCVCLLLLLCCLFVVGWQQHCTYCVMTPWYIQFFGLEDELSSGKVFESLDWVWYSYIWRWGFVFATLDVININRPGVTWILFLYAWKNFWTWELWQLRVDLVLDDVSSSIGTGRIEFLSERLLVMSVTSNYAWIAQV